MPRFYCPTALMPGSMLQLPAGAARHVQVLRLQPGDAITLFGPSPATEVGGEFCATITQMGRNSVQVLVGRFSPVQREAKLRAHLAVGMPANERMDWLVEKATELGVASIQPLMTERSVLRLNGERADKKQAHWQSVAVAACEQCGGNRMPVIHAVKSLADWLAQAGTPESMRVLLTLQPDSQAVSDWRTKTATSGCEITILSGPEGGLSRAEEDTARSHSFAPVSLGPRVLRAETAALAALTLLLA